MSCDAFGRAVPMQQVRKEGCFCLLLARQMRTWRKPFSGASVGPNAYHILLLQPWVVDGHILSFSNERLINGVVVSPQLFTSLEGSALISKRMKSEVENQSVSFHSCSPRPFISKPSKS